MAGCLDNLQIPEFNMSYFTERRNKVASILSGVLFFLGWWIAIDTAIVYPDGQNFNKAFLIFGVVGTISFFMVNVVSNGQLRGDDGCLGSRGALVWFFVGFLLGFGSIIGSLWVMFGEYVIDNPNNQFKPKYTYPGVAMFFQNAFIFFSSLIYKFGRTEDMWQ